MIELILALFFISLIVRLLPQQYNGESMFAEKRISFGWINPLIAAVSTVVVLFISSVALFMLAVTVDSKLFVIASISLFTFFGFGLHGAVSALFCDCVLRFYKVVRLRELIAIPVTVLARVLPVVLVILFSLNDIVKMDQSGFLIFVMGVLSQIVGITSGAIMAVSIYEKLDKRKAMAGL